MKKVVIIVGLSGLIIVGFCGAAKVHSDRKAEQREERLALVHEREKSVKALIDWWAEGDAKREKELKQHRELYALHPPSDLDRVIRAIEAQTQTIKELNQENSLEQNIRYAEENLRIFDVAHR
jgi:uncharacterized protein YbaP (TraB family)